MAPQQPHQKLLETFVDLVARMIPKSLQLPNFPPMAQVLMEVTKPKADDDSSP